MKSYSTRDAARLLGLSEPQIRSHARVGYLRPDRGPRNAYRFSFQDLVLLRTAKALRDARIPPRRIRQALRTLTRELPSGRSLSEVTISSEGTRIVVRDGRAVWHPESGQLLLDFDVGTLAARAAPVARRLARQAHTTDTLHTAAAWFGLGVDLEAVTPDEATEAYRRAITIDPTHVAARVNLGRLLQELGRANEAVAQYRAALALTPHHATAAFNLGTALEELRREREAIDAYRQAVGADEFFADAHFNLARLYERAGQRTAALRHLRMYKALSQDDDPKRGRP